MPVGTNSAKAITGGGILRQKARFYCRHCAAETARVLGCTCKRVTIGDGIDIPRCHQVAGQRAHVRYVQSCTPSDLLLYAKAEVLNHRKFPTFSGANSVPHTGAPKEILR